ncbi:hypothetical protein DSM112329_00090 [Paraconexibacter sp. AEG42_29]|uniref:AbiEi antitoxin C-terminal domain-containing protein n=1 Tax=Paraconexibacter sp. AEG42_29 TaxID=2997339 RepID=A0AAU7ANV5_9ACTN
MPAPWFPDGFDIDLHSPGAGARFDAVLTALADRQHQTVCANQIVALGWRRDRLRPRRASGHITRFAVGTYLVGATTASPRAWRAAAIHAGGAGAVLAGLTSAAHLGGDVREPHRVQIVVPPGGRVQRARVAARDAVVHDHERMIFDGLPCMTWARTLLDLAAYRPRQELEHVWHDAIYRRRLDDEAIVRVLSEHRGEPGIVAFRALWERRLLAIGRSANKLESDLRDIVVEAGLPEPRRNVRLRIDGATLRPDLYIPERKLAIETDGKDGHRDPEQQLVDAERDALYRRLGLEPVRYAWWPVTYQRPGVEADFARFEAEWQRTGGTWTAEDPMPRFRYARTSS